MLLLLDSLSSFLTIINIYTRPTFVPSQNTIGLKLRSIKCFKGFSLVESPTSPISATQLIYELNLYLYITYIYTKFGDNRIKITPSIVCICGHTYTHIHTYRHKLISSSRSMLIYDSHTWEILRSESRFWEDIIYYSPTMYTMGEKQNQTDVTINDYKGVLSIPTFLLTHNS